MIEICPYCHMGRLQKRAVTYVQSHGDRLLVTNQMPAVVCDVCGERVYDNQAVEQLQRLLWANTGSRTASRSHYLT